MNARICDVLTEFNSKAFLEIFDTLDSFCDFTSETYSPLKGELSMCDEKKDEVGLSDASKKILRWASWMGEVVCFFIDHGHEDDVQAMFHVMDAATNEIGVLIEKHETEISEAFHTLKALFGPSCNVTDADSEFVAERLLEAIERIKGATDA